MMTKSTAARARGRRTALAAFSLVENVLACAIVALGIDATQSFTAGEGATPFAIALPLALLPVPLLVGLAELYFGHPGAAEIHGLQMAANSAACVALLATWTALKKLNRQTAAAFDEQIQQLLAK